jgi:molecular chaperone Hsp33
VRLAVAEVVTPQGRSWRAGGLLLQYLPASGLAARDLPPGDAPAGGPDQDAQEEADAWTEGLALAATLEDHELVDPSLSAEQLLFRLFHERGVKVFAERELAAFCRCSDSRVENLLRSFSTEERAHMIGDDGRIGVTCEFCGALRSYDPALFD